MSTHVERKSGAWELLLVLALGLGRRVRRVFAKNRDHRGQLHIAQALDEPSAKTGRGEDRNLHPDDQTSSHERWGTLIVVCVFLAAFAAGLGFMFIYWTEGSNVLLGGTFALCLGSIGLGLMLWAHWLMLSKEAVDPRENLQSPEPEREAALQVFREGKHDVQRRKLLTWLSVSAITLLGAMFVSLFRSFGRPPGPSLFDTIWSRGQRLMSLGGKPVTADALQPGSTMVVFPEANIGEEKAQTVLLRVKEQFLNLPEERANWAPMGYLAYSRVCTHAGCAVGLFEATTDLLLCPCHQSTFDVLRAGVPTSGPAARPLPQLPLYVDNEGYLCAGGAFTEPPGPGFWSIPCPGDGEGCNGA